LLLFGFIKLPVAALLVKVIHRQQLDERRVDTPSPARSPGSERKGPGGHVPYQTGIKRRQATTPHLTPAYNPLKFLLNPLFQEEEKGVINYYVSISVTKADQLRLLL
jgi:hypothetical protein